MDIKNIADLSKIADLCRKKGIESIKITQDAVEFTLAESQLKTRTRRNKSKNTTDNIETNAPTEEELLFWSSQGIPEEAIGTN